MVNNRKRGIQCPHCGSRHTAEILYGMPAFSEELERQMETGEIVLGGCMIDSIPMNEISIGYDPKRHCNECNKDFGTPPLLIAKDHSSAEDYRDIVTSIQFSVGGFFGGFKQLTLSKNESGAAVEFSETLPRSMDELVSVPDQISTEEWIKLLDTLYAKLLLHEWKHSFVDPGVLDGTQWELRLKLTGGRTRTYSGSNDYPPYWKRLLRAFQKIAPIS